MKAMFKGLSIGALAAATIYCGFSHLWLFLFLPYGIGFLIFVIPVSIFHRHFDWFKEDPFFGIIAAGAVIGWILSFFVEGGGGSADLFNTPRWFLISGAIFMGLFGSLVGLGTGLPDEADPNDMPLKHDRIWDEEQDH